MPNNISLALVKQAFLEYHDAREMLRVGATNNIRAEGEWKVFKDKLQFILREQARKAANRKAGIKINETK